MANVFDIDHLNKVKILEKKVRIKRTESDMLQSVANDPIAEAQYLKARIVNLEDKICKLLGSGSEKARDMILSQRPELERYLP